MTPLLSCRGVSKKFLSGGEETAVLAGVDLDVERGEFICVAGANGSGKTTLLRILGSFTEPDDGEVRLRGVPAKRPGPERIMVFQETRQLFPWKTVYENLDFPLRNLRPELGRKERADRIGQCLSLVGLSGAEASYPLRLSVGMRQRASIARSLVLEPEVLLMDEPFSSLDAPGRRSLQKMVKSLRNKHMPAVVLVTHDIEESLLLADRLYLLTPGEGGSKGTVYRFPGGSPPAAGSPEFDRARESLYAAIDTEHE